MRKNRIVLAAFAGIASGALGQSASLSIVASQTVVDSTVTTSITLAVYGDADLGTHLTSSGFGISADGGVGVVDNMVLDSVPSWVAPNYFDDGYAGDGNYNGLEVGQFVFLPFLQPDPATELGNGPVLLANFRVEISAGATGVIDWDLVAIPDPHIPSNGIAITYTIDIYGCPACGPPGSIHGFVPNFGSTSVRVVPAPSGLALIGLGVLVVGRRRCV